MIFLYDCRILMTPCQIAGYNRQNIAAQKSSVVDLLHTDYAMDKEAIMVHQTVLPCLYEQRFDGHGHFIDQPFYDELEKTMAWSQLACEQEARFALVVDQCLMRLFPTNAPSYKERWLAELDRFALTLLKLGEAILIWHQSNDGKWLFVQNRHAWGWIPTEAAAFCREDTWRSWCGERDFIQVIASRTTVDYQESDNQFTQQFLMGTRLPLRGQCAHQYIVQLPRRDKKGKLVPMMISLPDDERFQEGFLPFQEGRIAEQAMKTLGEPYGWGGERTYRDCTSLIDDIFGTFSFVLARNSRDQRAMKGVKKIDAQWDNCKREKLIKKLPRGTVLYMPGHAMLYLGVRDGNLRILHSVYQIGIPMWSDMVTYKAKRVMLGHLYQYRANGKTFLESLSDYWCPWAQDNLNCPE